ncbi:MAG: pyridoxamine 5'-phosphate oxidase family protein [Bacteroides sp.]|nr:pyridoxamine 5'-phosphate oxidase family protein [Bacteroides sp.]
MNKAFDFLRLHKEVAFATVENGKPRLRVFQIMKLEDTMLYFVTSPTKAVYCQLQKNSAIEILSMEGNISVRLWGNAVFDVDDDIAREIYATNPVLPRLYKHYTDLAYFRLNLVGLDYFDLMPTPPLFEHYDF